MTAKKKATALTLILILAAGLIWGWWKLAGYQEIRIINIGNLHSQLLPFELAGAAGRSERLGGAANIGAVLQDLKTTYPEALVTETGDWVTGSWWRLFGGQPEFETAGRLGIQVGVLGNHEFNQGLDTLSQALAKWADFPLLGSNLNISHPDLSTVVQSNVMLETASGIQVGFFGLITPDLATISYPGPGVQARRDVLKTAQEQVAALKARGADFIILLSHNDLDADLELARQVQGIGAILNGYESAGRDDILWIEGPGGWSTAVCLSDSLGRSLSLLTLTQHRGRPVPEKSGWRLAPVLDQGRGLQEIAALVEGYAAKADNLLSVPIGTLLRPADATKASSRGGETALGDFLADALRWRAGTQIALLNAGGIRGDRIFPAGPFSLGTVMEIFPFQNSIWVKTMTGAELRQALELSASSLIGVDDDYQAAQRIGHGGFMHVSGLRLNIALARFNQPALLDEDGRVTAQGNRVKSVEILSAGRWRPLNDSEEYTVAVLSFTADGGDKYRVVAESPGYDTQLIDSEAVIDYMEHFGAELEMLPDGRQVFEF